MKGTKSVISDENKRLCLWLKRQRQDKGHTMRSLSEVLGTPHSFIGKVENQERRLDVVCRVDAVDDRVEIAIIEESQPRWLSFLNREHDLLERWWRTRHPSC